MSTKRVAAWLFGAGLAASALWLTPVSATEPVLILDSKFVNSSCLDPETGATFYTEAWGYDASNRKVCEVSVAMGAINFSGGMCVGAGVSPATQQKAVVTTRNNSTRAWVSTRAQDSQLRPFTAGSVALYTLPAHGSCASSSVTSISYGVNN